MDMEFCGCNDNCEFYVFSTCMFLRDPVIFKTEVQFLLIHTPLPPMRVAKRWCISSCVFVVGRML